MEDLIGSVGFIDRIDKNNYLIFDKIAVPDVFYKEQDNQRVSNDFGSLQLRNDVDWLVEHDLMVLMNISDLSKEVNSVIDMQKDSDMIAAEQFCDMALAVMRNPFELKRDLKHRRITREQWYSIVSNATARVNALRLRFLKKLDAHPIIDNTGFSDYQDLTTRSTVLNVIIKSFPTIDDKVPWENIADFKKDPDSKKKLLSLRRWISKISSENRSFKELEEELEFLMSEYSTHLELHKMKTKLGVLETIIKSPLEVIENIVKLRWAQIPDALFSLKKYKLAMYEAELNAPGREVSYILKARDSFDIK